MFKPFPEKCRPCFFQFFMKQIHKISNKVEHFSVFSSDPTAIRYAVGTQLGVTGPYAHQKQNKLSKCDKI